MALRHSSRLLPILGAFTLAACGGHSGAAGRAEPEAAGDPAAAAQELLAADREFSAASERTDVIAGLAPMFANDVAMPAPEHFVTGRDSVLEALRANPDNTTSHYGWTPVRVGVSADGQQGFTFGYGTVRGSDGPATPVKYLTYWVKSPEGWRAVAFKRGRAPSAPPGPPAPMAPALPTTPVAASSDPARVERFRESLDSAERAFSRDAQEIGLQAAFARYGSADAVNMGGPARAEFVVGADSIAAAVAEGEPDSGSSVSWAPDVRVVVASSGDLGLTIGTIVANQPDSAGTHRKFPFFTVWRRSGPGEPWRYVAE